MIKLIIFLSICFQSSLLQSYAGTIHPLCEDSKYCDYGNTYKHVVKLNCRKNEKKHEASAVIILPNWALTAAHIVKEMDNAVIIKEKKEYKINKIISHKDFKEEIFGTNDIALLFSEQSFEMNFYPDLYEEDNELGKIAGICGYGLTGNFIAGANMYDGKIRAGTNTIDSIEENILICDASSNNRTILEFLIASGDSGGGLFIDGKLAGINSLVFSNGGKKNNSTYGNNSGHTRISKYVPWIRKNIKENEIFTNSK